MKKLLINALFALAISAIIGCKREEEVESIPERKVEALYSALRNAWGKYAANSASCYSARGLAKHDADCRNLCECFRQSGIEVELVYKLGDWFLLECCSLKTGEGEYLKLGCASADGRIVCREFDLDDGFWMNVAAYASPLRFAPIVKDSLIGFTEMWDSMSDSIVKVPIGFHGLCQFGSGIFLLRKDASSEYYRWNAVTKEEPEAWKYRFPTGCNPRSSFFIALSCETGKSYAFAMGLEPIPNSEGATAISPRGAYKGRHFYKIWKDGEMSGRYYAWPEADRSEPLSNCAETFDGCPLVYRDGKLVVLTHNGAVDVFDAKH